MKTILIINAHQKYEGFTEGRLNATLVSQAETYFEKKGFKVLRTVIDQGYDIKKEIEKHLQSDLVILQGPVNWFNLPWSYKKYADELFTEALLSNTLVKNDGRSQTIPTAQYGSGGLMVGKSMFLSTTWNAPQESFNHNDQVLLAGSKADDVLLNIGLNYKFCGYNILPGYHCFDVMKNPNPQVFFSGYENHLDMIVERLEIEK
jgi:modulator of drug activity B